MEQLKNNGYLVLRNIIPKNRNKYAKSQINSKVNYFRLKKFIDEDMINNINTKLDLNLDYTKYRVSNNNNSTDAASFHRDLQSYELKSPKVYTCLTYLEEAYMEVIPQSHKNISVPLYKINGLMNKKIKIKMNPGDILIFYATLVHRGLFYISNNKNRRIIQLFDCIDKENIIKTNTKILHIPCRNNCSSLVNKLNILLNKSYIISELINFVSSIIVLRGYGYPYNSLKFITTDNSIKYLSTDSNKKRIRNTHKDKFLESNVYIMNINKYKDIKENDRNIYLFFSFTITTIICIIVMILLIILIINLLLLIKNYK